VVAWAWSPGPLLEFDLAASLNNLDAGQILDLDLGLLAGNPGWCHHHLSRRGGIEWCFPCSGSPWRQICCRGAVGEDLPSTELINVDGFDATANLCRHGGRNSTYRRKALLRSGHGCSRPIRHEVMCSPWRFGGPWLRFITGRGPLSSWLLLLGCDASRTPASGGGGARDSFCKLLSSSKVLFVKKIGLISR
jgi:hypothetical protein